ncbi:MAG: hypothetical protein LBT56_02000 [Prevotellaceae bacterium]|nr:hypothetical protein [Prevotellaceae bacterium]
MKNFANTHTHTPYMMYISTQRARNVQNIFQITIISNFQTTEFYRRFKFCFLFFLCRLAHLGDYFCSTFRITYFKQILKHFIMPIFYNKNKRGKPDASVANRCYSALTVVAKFLKTTQIFNKYCI